MPTYQYVCTDCGNALEVQQSFTDDSLTTCPTCTGRLRKVFNAVGVVFKGSGFYRNDSRAPSAESNGAKESSGSTEKAESKGSDSGSGDSKTSEKSGSDKPAGKGDKSGSGAGASSGSAKSSASAGSAA